MIPFVRVLQRGNHYYITDKMEADYCTVVQADASDVFHGVLTEVNRHFNKWGEQYLDPANWVMVITEEWGEAVASLNEGDLAHAKKEIIETITCLVRLYNEVKARENGGRVGVTYTTAQ